MEEEKKILEQDIQTSAKEPDAERMSEEREPKLSGFHLEVKKLFPDKEFADDAQAENALLESFKTLSSDNDTLKDSILQHPELALLLKELKEGTPLSVALIRAGIEVPNLRKGEDGYEDFVASETSRKKAKEEAGKAAEQFKVNREKSLIEIEDFFASKAMTDEETDEFARYVDDAVRRMNEGIFDKDLLNRLYRGYKYEEEVEAAREAGEIDGRNAKIEVLRAAAKHTDGLPSGTGATKAESKPSGNGYIQRVMKGEYI